MLNVQQVRLRFIFARALYLHRLFAKAYGSFFSKAPFCKYTAYLRCRLTKNSPRRIKDTTAGVFCTLLASIPSLCKSLRKLFFESVLLKIYGASTALSHRQNYTSVYSFDCEFRAHAKHRFWLIRAAAMPLLKMLNVSERTRMSVVSRSSEI